MAIKRKLLDSGTTQYPMSLVKERKRKDCLFTFYGKFIIIIIITTISCDFGDYMYTAGTRSYMYIDFISSIVGIAERLCYWLFVNGQSSNISHFIELDKHSAPLGRSQ